MVSVKYGRATDKTDRFGFMRRTPMSSSFGFSEQRRLVVLHLLDEPRAELMDLRRVGCRFATNDPISKFRRNGFLQRPNQTSGDEVERCKRRSRQGYTL